MKKKISVKAHLLHCIVGLLFLLPNIHAQVMLSDVSDCNALVGSASGQIIGHVAPTPFCDYLERQNRGRRLVETGDCTPPSNLSADAVNSDIQLNWSDVIDAVGYLITYQNLVTGATGQVISGTASYTLNNLPPGVYVISVQTLCDGLMLSAPVIIVEAVIITDIAMIRADLDEKNCGCTLEDPVFDGNINEDELVLGWDDECIECPSNLSVAISTAESGDFSFGLAYANKNDTVSISSCSRIGQNPVVNQSNQSIDVLIEGRKIFVIRFSESVGMVIDQFDMENEFNVRLERCKNIERGARKIDALARNTETKQSLSTNKLQSQPNPFNNNLQVQYTVNQEGPAALRLYDYSGRVVVERFLINQQKGDHQLQLDTSKLPAGLYFLSYESAEGKITQSVLKTE